ncbi:hypothetical protein N5B55_04950 [Ralstonia pickettii]|uniref:hypothetical protein n=1 Tax=Ralstonia pickettii TaxID=329 RepID=UPI0027155C87|nr:hypothetical protein [Ralstonia pickettii]WKZ86302.1 hypothetical protein N5B55_04950 [Ralstonia pickettii]
MITEQRKSELQQKGFSVEDMEKVWGPGWWSGQFRWVRKECDDFQDGDTSDSEDAAWVEADRYATELCL